MGTNEAETMEVDVPQVSSDSLDDSCNHVARLFGELQRCGIFSHDNYVRYILLFVHNVGEGYAR